MSFQDPVAVSGSGTVTAPLTLTIADAATNTVVYPLIVSHTTSATSGNSFGVGVQMKAEQADGALEIVGNLYAYRITDTIDAEDYQVKLDAMIGGSIVNLVSIARSNKDVEFAGTVRFIEQTGVLQALAKNAASFRVQGDVADGATAVGVSVRNSNALANAAARHLSIGDTAERVWFGPSGYLHGGTGSDWKAFSPDGVVSMQVHNSQWAFGGTGAVYGDSTGINCQATIFSSNDGAVQSGKSTHRWSQVWAFQYAGVEQAPTDTATPAFDCANGESIYWTLRQNTTSWTLASGKKNQTCHLWIIQDSTGNWTFDGEPANVKGLSGYVATAAANSIDYILLQWNATIASWYAVLIKQNLVA